MRFVKIAAGAAVGMLVLGLILFAVLAPRPDAGATGADWTYAGPCRPEIYKGIQFQ